MQSIRCLQSLRLFNNLTGMNLSPLTSSFGSVPLDNMLVITKTCREHTKTSTAEDLWSINLKASISTDSGPKGSKSSKKDAGSKNSSEKKVKDSKSPEGKGSGPITVGACSAKVKNSVSKASKGEDSKALAKQVGPEGKNLDSPQDVFRNPRPAVLGPGASPDGKYKVPEYFSYSPFSYFQMEIVMAKLRVPQPVAIPKKKQEAGPETAEAEKGVDGKKTDQKQKLV